MLSEVDTDNRNEIKTLSTKVTSLVKNEANNLI